MWDKLARQDLYGEVTGTFTHITKCPLCESKDLELIRTEASGLPSEDPYFRPYCAFPIHLQRCRSCGFAFVDRLPADPEFNKHLYAHQCDWGLEVEFHGKGLIFQHAKKTILKFQSGGRLLDIGAWIGGFLEVMADRFQGTGVEIDPIAAETARKRGFAVRGVPFMDANLPSNYFDAVTLIDVLEHMPEPARHLLIARDVLKVGGVLYIKVPNYAAQMRKQDYLARLGLSTHGIMGAYVHINHFSRPALSGYLTKIGFDVLASGFTPSEIWNPGLKGSRGQKVKRLLSNIWRTAGTFVANQAALLLNRECGFNLYVLARKR